MEIVNRAMATLLNKKRYYTGVLCRNGHLSERYTSTGNCISCLHPLWRLARPQLSEVPKTVVLRLPKDMTPQQFEALQRWLQDACVPTFLAGQP